MTKFMYTRPDGGVSVITIPPGVTVQDALALAVPPDATDVVQVFDGDIPTDRTYRNAWRASGAKVVVDMPEARKLHMQRLRAVRDNTLRELDSQTLRHLNNPQELAKVEEEKQRLRDMPLTVQPQVDAATSPEELKQAGVDFFAAKP